MSAVRIAVHENQSELVASSFAEVESILNTAAHEARDHNKLNIVYMTAENGNSLSVVVDSNDTVLNFMYAHLNPPYYVSRGPAPNDDPVLTAFIGLEHHTEYPRQWVIELENGMLAIQEFVESGGLPKSIAWVEP